MNRTDSPKKQPVIFGVNGQREDILDTTPSGDNTASYNSGFPPITMILKSAGGLPPKGQDINQILYELSALGRWSSSGVMNTFDSAFATSIGGYPSGAFVLGDDLKTVYRCTTDGNTANPNSVTTGWAKIAQDIADILSLGTAAYRGVGTGTNQIPDMASFVFNLGGSGAAYNWFPGGNLLQMGRATTSTTGQQFVSIPITYPNANFNVVAIPMDQAVPNIISAAGTTASQIAINGWGANSSGNLGQRVSTPIFWMTFGN